MNTELDIRRGLEAEQILGAKIYKEAFAQIEERLINELAQVEIKPERAEYVRQLLAMGRKYRGYLEQVVLTGKMAVMEEERKKSLAERAIDRVRVFARS